jgi:cytoskeleton-associated protein 5
MCLLWLGLPKQVQNNGRKATSNVTAACKACPNFPERVAHICVGGAVDKLGDSKIKVASAECLNTFSECWTVNDISMMVCKRAGAHTNPKVMEGALDWITNAVNTFGFKHALKPHVEFGKNGTESKNVGVKKAALAFFSTLRIHVGPALAKVCKSVGLTLEAEFAKVEGATAPAPTLFERSDASKGDSTTDSAGAVDGREDTADDGSAAAATAAESLISRVDIESMLQSSTVAELDDKSWKVRAEALVDVGNALKKACNVTPALGDLGSSLMLRLRDSNKNIIITTLGLLGELATAMGPGSKKNCNLVLPGIYETLTDSKDAVRLTALKAMDALFAEVGLGPFVEGDMVAKPLTSGKSQLLPL